MNLQQFPSPLIAGSTQLMVALVYTCEGGLAEVYCLYILFESTAMGLLTKLLLLQKVSILR